MLSVTCGAPLRSCLVLDHAQRVVVTACGDGLIRLWTFEGSCVGELNVCNADAVPRHRWTFRVDATEYR